jgi:hypothetical protein
MNMVTKQIHIIQRIIMVAVARKRELFISRIEILTTRFSNYGIKENRVWRDEHGLNTSCVYGTPVMITHHVMDDAYAFVIEMNNDKNKVEGIGLIRNKVCEQRYRRIHSEPNLNRYSYEGEYRVDVSQIGHHEDDEDDEYYKKLIQTLEVLLFKGKRHSKRSIGISRIPNWIKYNRFDYDFGKALFEMFEKYAGADAGAGLNIEIEI